MKITYNGPGDAVELDGLSIKKGEVTEVTAAQYARITADREAQVDVVDEKKPRTVAKEGGR